ncbi:RNA polymerase-associated protein CTR9 homolog, partial [Striga asiatica]
KSKLGVDTLDCLSDLFGCVENIRYYFNSGTTFNLLKDDATVCNWAKCFYTNRLMDIHIDLMDQSQFVPTSKWLGRIGEKKNESEAESSETSESEMSEKTDNEGCGKNKGKGSEKNVRGAEVSDRSDDGCDSDGGDEGSETIDNDFDLRSE